MAVELVYTDAPGELPADYQLQSRGSFRLASSSAYFDGDAAASSFYPCLSVYSQDNKLIGRFFASQQMEPGDEAEVTFGPF